MAAQCPEGELPIWTCVNEMSTPDLRLEDFYSALEVWISRPQVASPRFLGAISINIDTREDMELLLSHFPRECTEAFVDSVWGVLEVVCRKLLPKQKHFSPVEEFVLFGRYPISVSFYRTLIIRTNLFPLLIL